LFIKNLGKTQGEIKCIPNTEEKYISFSKIIPVDSFVKKEGKEVMRKHEIRFIDSFKFMASSLNRLVSNFTDCGKCDSCRPGDCLKRFVKERKIIQWKGIGPCGKCRNCKKFDYVILICPTYEFNKTSGGFAVDDRYFFVISRQQDQIDD